MHAIPITVKKQISQTTNKKKTNKHKKKLKNKQEINQQKKQIKQTNKQSRQFNQTNKLQRKKESNKQTIANKLIHKKSNKKREAKQSYLFLNIHKHKFQLFSFIFHISQSIYINLIFKFIIYLGVSFLMKSVQKKHSFLDKYPFPISKLISLYLSIPPHHLVYLSIYLNINLYCMQSFIHFFEYYCSFFPQSIYLSPKRQFISHVFFQIIFKQFQNQKQIEYHIQYEFILRHISQSKYTLL
ncbi:transmembrane protein, putative (macronuclear) [Tetrahymena thermophila SB210]|uniref:Transmembrane protein, putative n=1 Tax=Tetrahymena thermophila (strain SB210) TaxID=312017 RepID=W7XK43_TETTS|nr:transmembrane protein, putative [Tetrahymena thermophila SB210]EWS76201.1 transmembrane protein, putative [Tetrahymena thermophila SB210]|eukprot:XP_012651248.1 transmembrane protein, putative [Tetrahymena thermophila SB210]